MVLGTQFPGDPHTALPWSIFAQHPAALIPYRIVACTWCESKASYAVAGIWAQPAQLLNLSNLFGYMNLPALPTGESDHAKLLSVLRLSCTTSNTAIQKKNCTE